MVDLRWASSASYVCQRGRLKEDFVQILESGDSVESLIEGVLIEETLYQGPEKSKLEVASLEGCSHENSLHMAHIRCCFGPPKKN